MMFNITFIMQSVKSHSNFQSKKKCFKIKDGETKEEMGSLYFQIEGNLIYMFLYANLL